VSGESDSPRGSTSFWADASVRRSSGGENAAFQVDVDERDVRLEQLAARPGCFDLAGVRYRLDFGHILETGDEPSAVDRVWDHDEDLHPSTLEPSPGPW
jgi:hypothetical protein